MPTGSGSLTCMNTIPAQPASLRERPAIAATVLPLPAERTLCRVEVDRVHISAHSRKRKTTADRCAVYLRISDDRANDAHGVARQLKQLLEIISDMGWTLMHPAD